MVATCNDGDFTWVQVEETIKKQLAVCSSVLLPQCNRINTTAVDFVEERVPQCTQLQTRRYDHVDERDDHVTSEPSRGEKLQTIDEDYRSWGEVEGMVIEKLALCPKFLSLESIDDHGRIREVLESALKECKSPTEQVAIVAFYHGMTASQKLYSEQLKALQEQYQEQLKLLQDSTKQEGDESDKKPRLSLTRTFSSAFRPNKDKTDRTVATSWSAKGGQKPSFSARFRPPLPKSKKIPGSIPLRCGSEDSLPQITELALSASQGSEGKSMVTALSVVSCRELSMQRYQRTLTKSLNILPPNGKGASEKNRKEKEAEKLLQELQKYESRVKVLERQLVEKGVTLAEDIPYQEAKDQVVRISQRMQEIHAQDGQIDDPVLEKSLKEEYFCLENEMGKYLSALMLTDEWRQEEEQREKEWEKSHAVENLHALESIRRHMPVDIRNMSLEQLTSPEVGLPADMAKKFKRTNVLQLLRRDPQEITRLHASNLENLGTIGLTLTERRALHHHLLPVYNTLMEKGSTDPMVQRKLTWVKMMRSNFREALDRFESHVKATDSKKCSQHECQLIGKQCPVRANLMMDYQGDLNFPPGDVYQVEDVFVSGNKNNSNEEREQPPRSFSFFKKKEQPVDSPSRTKDLPNDKARKGLLATITQRKRSYSSDSEQDNKSGFHTARKSLVAAIAQKSQAGVSEEDARKNLLAAIAQNNKALGGERRTR